MTNGNKTLLFRHEVEAVHRQPYILSGYRQTNISFFQCLQYALVLHNDVVNFWTHFLPLPAWLVWFFALVSHYDLDLSQPYSYPLVCSWIGSCSYALFSSIAHLFSSKSLLVHEVCFMLDYLGIAMYGLGLNIAGLFYLSPSNSPFFSYTSMVLTFEVSFAVMASIIGSLSRFYWTDYRFIIRVSAFVLPYVCYIGPFLHRACICWLYGTDCIPGTSRFHFLSTLATAMAVFFYISKIPERFMPGRFDTFVQSHQFFHICCVISTSFQIHSFPMELELRGDGLRQVDGAMPSWETTILPFVCAEVFGLVAVTMFGVHIQKGVLASNMINDKKTE